MILRNFHTVKLKNKQMKNKRKIFVQILAIFLCLIFFVACSPKSLHKKSEREIFDGFSVHFLDVGQGDCIFIRFSDGKNMLIDCAEKDEDLSEFIVGFLKDYGVKNVDYLVLTHPDSDHTGNALSIINNFNVKKAYLPQTGEHALLYPTFSCAQTLLNEKQVEITTSSSFICERGDDYGFAFLSPNPAQLNDSSYDDFLSSPSPTANLSNALSPIIYIESRGVKFVFTGDAPIAQEEIAIENAHTNKLFYNSLGVNVDLENVDFLKVGHHGSNDSSGSNFLGVLKPKHAVISLHGDNNYQHPNRDVLDRLNFANPNYNLWRTDVYGTISVQVDSAGGVEIITDKRI